MSRSKSPRQLTATDSAAIEVNDTLIDSRLARMECMADQEELKKEAETCSREAEKATQRQVHGGHVTSTTTLRGWAGIVLIISAASLAYVLFISLGIPWPLALLLSCVEAAVFAGAGSLAVEKMKLGGQQRLAGSVLLLSLAAVAVWLVPKLAEARADEMYAERITAAQARVDVSRQLSGKHQSRGERVLLQNAQHELASLPAQRERAKDIFMILLTVAMAGEILLSSYSADMLSRGRARRLRKKADRLEADARDAGQEAADQDLIVYQDLSDVAREHAVSIDTIDRLTQARNAVHVSGDVFAVPNQSGKPATPPSTSTVVTVGPTSAPPQTPAGSITNIETPILPTAPETEWDGVWA